ncbi:MAG: hypothetical protein ACRCYU_12020 [Nocardioides sp.]
MIGLIQMGVKPTHIASFRRAGCRTTTEVIEAAEAGIDAKRADELCALYGQAEKWYGRGGKPKATLPAGHLVGLHRNRPDEEATE